MSITSLGVLVLLAIGHAELQVAAINRIHGLAWPDWVLTTTRRLHDFVMVSFPIGLVAAHWLGPEWFRDERWEETPLGWQVVAGLCGLGLISLTVSAIRWQLRRPASTQIAASSRIVDFRKQLGPRSLGNGPRRWIAQLPWNEVRQVEFQEQHFHCPHLPSTWDQLSILHLSDFHLMGTLSREFFQAVCVEANRETYDLVVFTGDLFDDDSLRNWLPETLGTLRGKLGQFYILGNHDERQDPVAIRDAMNKLGWEDVSGRVLALDYKGHPLEIAGTERPWMGVHPPLNGGVCSTFRVLLSHTPDQYRWAQRHRVDVMLSGHNHGGQVVLPIFGPVYAPSLYGVKYSAGSWYREPTLLSVSPGLSGEIPLRWNCRPAITKLVLHSTTKKTC